jgi:L-ribulose-5-phosphate 3-epimerase
MLKFGVMQGRLTEPRGRGIQFFPFDNWKDEFKIASEIGLDELEFIFDHDDYENNPLWNKKGAGEIKEIKKDTGININSICFDYFMRRPFFNAASIENKKNLYQENKMFLEKMIETSKDLDIKLIEIPLVDDSSIRNHQKKEMFKDFLLEILRNQNHKDIFLGLETDFPPYEFKQFIDSFESPLVKANYDTGNSSALGYNVREEIAVLGELIFNIHIKDRIFKGGTVELGKGDVDFKEFFKSIKNINYSGSLILQAARGSDGYEKESVAEQLSFVKEYVNKFYK